MEEHLLRRNKKVINEQELKDLKLKNVLHQLIDIDFVDTILNADTSKQIWDNMKQKCQGSARIKRAQLLCKEFEMLNINEGSQ